MNQPSVAGAPRMAWLVPFGRLNGWLTRSVEVPPGHTGLLLRDGQPERTLPSGRHTVVAWSDLLFGRPSAVEVAIVRSGPFPVTLTALRLPNDEAKLADLWAQLVLRIGEPQACVTGYLREAGQATGYDLVSFLSAQAGTGLEELVRPQSLSIAGSPEAEGVLTARLLDVLLPAAGSIGVRVERLYHVTLRSSEHALRHAENVAELERRVRQADTLRRIEAGAELAEVLDMARQMERDFNLPEGALVGALEFAADRDVGPEVNRERLLARVKDLQEQAQREPETRMKRLAAGLAPGTQATGNQQGEEQVEISPGLIKLTSALRWGSYLVYAAFVLLAVLNPGDHTHEGWPRLVYLLGGLPFALAMFLSSLHLDRKAAEMRALERQHRLVALAGGRDLQQVAALVRQQIELEVDQTTELAKEVRKQLVVRAETVPAAKVNDALHAAERLRDSIRRPASGAPAYVISQSALSHAELSAILDREEELIRTAREMKAAAETLRDAVNGGKGDLPLLSVGLLNRINTLGSRLQERSRIDLPSRPSGGLPA